MIREWEDLFHILQVLNPESDKPSPHCLDEPEDEERVYPLLEVVGVKLPSS